MHLGNASQKPDDSVTIRDVEFGSTPLLHVREEERELLVKYLLIPLYLCARDALNNRLQAGPS